MSGQERRARAAVEYGPTAQAVATNVLRLRKARGLSIYTLSDRLRVAGRPITPSAVGKIERLARQVNVDDLTALAAALDVEPFHLMLAPAELRIDVLITKGGTPCESC